MCAEIGIPTLLSRSYLSSHHLWAARHFLRLVSEIEGAHSGRSTFSLAHRSYATSAILSSVAFLEAAVNELFQDACDNHGSYTGHLPERVLKSLRGFWLLSGEDQDRSSWSILDKYQAALLCSGAEVLPKAEQTYENAALLIRLRNSLVHYKPKTLGGEKTHRLEASLKGKFEPSRLFEGSGNPYFPDKCLGRGCAEWAINTSVCLADEVFRQLGVAPNYQVVTWTEVP
jgi:hypothetical protein